MPSDLLKAPLERKILSPAIRIPFWSHVLVVHALIGLVAAFLVSSVSGVVMFLVGFFGTFILWAGGLHLIIARSAEKKLASKLKTEAETALAAFARKPLQAADYSVALARPGMLAGSAIAWDGEALYIMDRGEAARIPLPLVREWRWEVTGAETLQTFGRVGAGMKLDVMEANMNASAAAYGTSGMFVTVADVGKPVWQFSTMEKGVLERWSEVLRQVTDAHC